MIFRANDKFGDYTLLDRFGVGGSGEVWLVERVTDYSAARYALKILHGQASSSEKNIRAEAENWSRLSNHAHPHIAPFVDLVIHEEDQIGFVSHYYDEGSLSDYLRQNTINVEAAVDLTIDILKGVQHSHDYEVIHRDLKPANILLNKGEPLLIDFGISRFISENMSLRTIGYSGTPEYSSPNALKEGIEKADDVWSVGVMLYEMLEGRLPFDASNPQLREAIQRDPPRPFEKDLSNTLKRIVLKALEKNPYKRFSSADEMRIALVRYKATEEARKRAREDWDVIVRRIVPGDSYEEEFLDLYSDIFPDDGTFLSRHHMREMLEADMPNRITKTHNIPLIATRNEELLGFIVCCYYEETNMAFIPYFAVKPGVSTSFETSRHLVEKLFKILYYDKACDYALFEVQVLDSMPARLDKFAMLSGKLGLDVRRFDIDYEGPKPSLDKAVDVNLMFFGIGIRKDINDVMLKNDMAAILEFVYIKVYGDVYEVGSRDFLEHHAHLQEHLRRIVSTLPNEVETLVHE